MPSVISISTIARHADRVVILVNPKAGSRAAGPWADGLARQLAKQGFRAELFTDMAEATSVANRWHAEGCLRTLVGAGGDGTAADLVNGAEPGVPITLLPTGNSNLLARYYGLSKDPETLCRTIADGFLARIDAGRANGRIFLIMAGCGFDAEVVRRVHEHRAGHICLRTYFQHVFGAIGSYEFPKIRVHCDDEDDLQPTLAARWVFAFNLPCYGGGFPIAPHSDGADGLLDLCTLRRGNLWHGLRYAAMVRWGWHQRMADWTTRRVRRLRMSAEGTVPYQLDGDPAGVLPLEVEVLPGRLTLVVPKEAMEQSVVRNGTP